MVFDHIVNHNGVYYDAGVNVPIDEESHTEAPLFNAQKHVYTEKELSGMTAKEIKKIAEENGYTIKKIVKSDIVKEFLSQQ